MFRALRHASEIVITSDCRTDRNYSQLLSCPLRKVPPLEKALSSALHYPTSLVPLLTQRRFQNGVVMKSHFRETNNREVEMQAISSSYTLRVWRSILIFLKLSPHAAKVNPEAGPGTTRNVLVQRLRLHKLRRGTEANVCLSASRGLAAGSHAFLPKKQAPKRGQEKEPNSYRVVEGSKVRRFARCSK